MPAVAPILDDAFVAALRTYGLVEVGRSDAQRIELVRPARGA